MNIFKFELKMNLKSTITWSISVFLIIFAFLALYPAFGIDASYIETMMKSFPKEFLQAFGLGNMNIAQPLGFLGFGFFFVQICLGIQAANYGFSLVSVEERELTADFLLTKPITRINILTGKLLAAITCIVITNAFAWISSFLFLSIYNNGNSYDTNALMLMLIGLLLLQLFFLCVPLAVSLLLRKIKSVLSFSMAFVFGFYVLSAFGGAISDDKISYFTPFKHFEPSYIIENVSLDMPKASISLVLIIISVVVSYILYKRRNIHSI